jgi:IS5 family transposase
LKAPVAGDSATDGGLVPRVGISHLKRRYGLNRTRLKGYTGAQIWAGYAVLTSNLKRFATVAG